MWEGEFVRILPISIRPPQHYHQAQHQLSLLKDNRSGPSPLAPRPKYDQDTWLKTNSPRAPVQYVKIPGCLD